MMTSYKHDARPRSAIPAPRPLLFAGRRDLFLTVLLTLMRFNPQEAMIIRAGMRQMAVTLSQIIANMVPPGRPVGARLGPIPMGLALSCVALLLTGGQVTGGMA
jgi:hypothetical protein